MIHVHICTISEMQITRISLIRNPATAPYSHRPNADREGPFPARLSCFNPRERQTGKRVLCGPAPGVFAELASWDCPGHRAYQSKALCLSTRRQGDPVPSPAHSGRCGRVTCALPRSCGSQLPCRMWSSLHCSCEASLSRGPWTASEHT